jgi:ribonuclease P protein component
MASVTGRFSRSDRLRASRDYRRVAAGGERFACPEFVLLVAPGGPAPTGRVRLGITASRRVGNAVVRNRVKRAVREWFRRCRGRIEAGSRGVDMVVIARRAAAELDARRVGERLCGLLDRRERKLRRAEPA